MTKKIFARLPIFMKKYVPRCAFTSGCIQGGDFTSTCKMQNDSMHCTSGSMAPNEGVTKDSGQSFNCNHCVLIFKTRLYLYEHLNQVHGLDVDAALRDSGLKSAASNKAKTDVNCKKSDFAFNCKNCTFKSVNWVIYSEHKKKCPAVATTINLNKEIATKTCILINKRKEPIGANDFKAKANPKSSLKDVKMYTKTQTITKYFSPASGTKVNPTAQSDPVYDPSHIDSVLLLQETPLSSSGVFQVTAKSIDMAEGPSQSYLLHDNLMRTDPNSVKPVDPFKEVVPTTIGKRIFQESTKGYPSKRAKTETVPETSSEIQSASCPELSFEVSEDEEEQTAVGEDVEATEVYVCKHCEFSDANLKRVFSHYEDNHPYIRCHSVYIQEKSDQTAMFRCLECPVEFSSEAELCKHYTEDHPEAPDVFTVKSSDLNFVCFVCPFTCKILHSLREHYKEEHPAHKVENPLMYCRYSATPHQDQSPQIDIFEDENNSPKRTSTPCDEDKSSAVSQNPTSEGSDGIVYQCGKCPFSHKSVVVLHVHYKKCHPEEEISLDKIKQSISCPSLVASEKIPTQAVDHSYSVMNEEDCISPNNNSNTENNSTIAAASPPSSSSSSTKAGLFPTRLNYKSLSPQENKIFFCNVCDFSHKNIRSVISHHNAKHSSLTTNIVDILEYTAERESKKIENETAADCEEDDDIVDASVTNTYPHGQDLYFCFLCNYGNPSIRGLRNHQRKMHEKIQTTKQHIMSYTAVIRDQIKKSVSNPTGLILPSGLPLPIVKEGDSPFFFCHLCNYRHTTVPVVVKHHIKMHKSLGVRTKEIIAYSAIVNQQLEAACEMKSAGHTPIIPAHPKKKISHKMKIKKNLKSCSVSGLPPQTKETLKCPECRYTSQFLYLMRKHLQKIHKRTQPLTDVVKLGGPGATFKPGYYCDTCSFSHKDMAVVSRHSRQRHTGRHLSHHCLITQLYLSPDFCAAINMNNDNADAGLATQSSGQRDTETHSCKACSFKGNSLSIMSSHYRAVHPWCVKEDGSVLDVSNSSKEQSTSSKVQDGNEYDGTFDTYQVPLEFDNLVDSTEEANTVYNCSYCPAKFVAHRGLLVHLGMKHRSEIAEEAPQVETGKSIRIFKCRCCSYVNNIYQGVLAHTQMRHPTKKIKGDSLYVASKHLHNVKKNVKNGILKFSGYLCKVCSQIYSSKEMLKKHRENAHSEFNKFSGPSLEIDGTRRKFEDIFCEHCGLYCSSTMELSHHTSVCKKNVSISSVLSCPYPCVLCLNSFSSKVCLGIHYSKKHGKAAFFKHYAPIYNQPSKKPAPDCAHPEKTSYKVSTEGKKVLVYKCPSCRYVNSATHGTLTHCQMRHPKVLVRADTLKTTEIYVANMTGCLSTKGSNWGGFRCRKCPKVYNVIKKLKQHCAIEHNQSVPTMSVHFSDTEQQQNRTDDITVSGSASSDQSKSNQVKSGKFCHFFKCSLCSYSTLILKQLGTHYSQRHGKASFLKFYSPLLYQAQKRIKTPVIHEETEKTENPFQKAESALGTTTPQVQTKLYKCSMCAYSSIYRRYLIAHYRNRHKLETQVICKKMEKYKKYKQTVSGRQFKCKVCLRFLESQARLLAHYCSYHRSEIELDFTIAAERSERTTGVYNCGHCKKKLFGIKNLSAHLDRHRAWKLRMEKTDENRENTTIEVAKQEPLLSSKPEGDETKLIVKPVENFTIKTSPFRSPFDPEPSNLPSSEGKQTCLRCKRSFMSLKGLRSHERSHAALAAIKKMDSLPASVFKEHIEKHLVYRPGTTRPFRCNICSYQTSVMGLWKSHIIKNHQYLLNSTEADKQNEARTQKDIEDAQNVGEEMNGLEGDDEPESSYLEPPDVQRQLTHYNLMAQIESESKTSVQKIQLSGSRMLSCEMCNFNSPHMSTMRRHYMRRHGRKLIRCKDCNFFTCLRQNLYLHEETGHFTVQSEPTYQKNLCCPFCLYQSKNKNNMIDHIVLHREERVTPIEVRRSKLSRYLEGIVFRCHQCTFTSGSADGLHLHMTKHNDIKPFKCRLCYFDCTELRDLEAHLCDKHQVVRNHQLVGQVSLYQLEARVPQDDGEEEEELLGHTSAASENMNVLKSALSSKEVSYSSQNNVPIEKDIGLLNEQPNENRMQDVVKENTDHSKEGEEFTDVTKTQKDYTKEMEACNSKLKTREKISVSSPVCVKSAHSNQLCKSFQDNKAEVENDLVQQIQQIDEDGSSSAVNKTVQGKEQVITTELVNSVNQKSQEDGKAAVSLNHHPEMNKSFKVNKSALILPSSVELRISPHVQQDQESSGTVGTNRNEGLDRAGQANPYGEMPILERFFKQEQFTDVNNELQCGEIRNDSNGIKWGKDESGLEEDHNPPAPLGGVSATDGAAEVHYPPVATETLFPCDFCGRNFEDTSELERHIMRHGL